MRAVKGRTSVLDDPLDRAAAARGAAGRAFLAVDGEGMLEIAERSIGVHIIAQGRSACCDRFRDHLPDGLGEGDASFRRLAGSAGKRARRPFRREMRPPKRLADIDIAKARNQTLIEKDGLERRFPVREGARHIVRGEGVSRRFNAHIPEMAASVECGAGRQIHEAEAARIVIDDAPAIGHMEDDMVMSRGFAARAVEIAGGIPRAVLLDPERAGHAEMHDEHRAVIHVRHQIFRPPAHGDNFAAFDACREILGKRKPQIGAALLDMADRATLHMRGKAAPDGFDFGKFGHGSR